MSRLKPITIPAGVEVSIQGTQVKVKSNKGTLAVQINDAVKVTQENNELHFQPKEIENARALSGTARALIKNMIMGVSEGYEKKLQLHGVGYRAAAQGKNLNLTLGFSHPVNFPIPEGVTIETPTATEIVIKGNDKQLVGQVAANIRSYRKPEPYKGKGVRYSKEKVILKEAKKK